MRTTPVHLWDPPEQPPEAFWDDDDEYEAWCEEHGLDPNDDHYEQWKDTHEG